MDKTLVTSVVLKLVDEMSGKVGEAVAKSKSHLDGFADKAKQVGDQLNNIGRTMATAGAVMGIGVGAAVKNFADLEAAQANLRSTMTGKDGLSANFQKVADLAVRLGNELPGNTEDFTLMTNKLIQLGVTEQAVLGGVGEAAAKLGAVMKIPYEEAATITAKLKEATGTTQEDMLQFIDIIQRVAHQGVSASEMGYAFARSAGGLKQFAIQGVEAANSVGAIYAQFIKAGMSGETVGTNFNTFLNTLAKYDFKLFGMKQDQVDAISDSLKEMGITLDFFDDKTKAFKGVDNVVAQLSKLQGLDQGKLTEILQAVFGGGTDQQMAALLVQGGTKAFESMVNSMAAQGDLQTRAAIQINTLSGKWEAAMGSFTTMLAKIGEQLAPVLKDFVDWFGSVSESIGKWVDENPKLAQAITVTIGGLAAALTAIGAGALAAGGIALTLGGIATGIGAIAAAATAAAPVLLALVANPAVAAILGVGAAAYAGWKFGNLIAEQIDLLVEKLTGRGSLGVLLYDMVQNLGKAFDEIPKAIKARFDGVVAYVKGLAQMFRDAGAFLVQGLIEGVKQRAVEAVASVQKLGTDVVQGLKDLLKIRSPSEVMADIGRQVAAGFVIGITAGAPGVADAAGQMAAQAALGASGGVLGAEGVAQQAEAYAAAEKAEQDHQQRMASMKAYFSSQALQNSIRYNRMNLDSTQFFFSQMGALMQTKSRALFEIGKVGAIGETIIQTYVGAQKAYAAMAGIPIVGPALGVAAAAAAVAAGLARVAAIRSTSFGSASGSPVLSGGGFSGPVVSGDSGVVPFESPAARQARQAPQRTVNITLSGEDVYSASSIRDRLIPALNDAIGDGATINVTTV